MRYSIVWQLQWTQVVTLQVKTARRDVLQTLHALSTRTLPFSPYIPQA